MKQPELTQVKRLHLQALQRHISFPILLSLFLFSGNAKSQTNIYGVDPFANALYSYTPGSGTWAMQTNVSLSMAGYTVQNGTSISYNPQNGMYYVVLKVTAAGGRRLATVDPLTGICTLVGNLGDNFSSLTFTPSGKLYGITGSGASISPKTLYEINPANATKIMRATLTNGADGQLIAFNPDDGFIYHWSGNTTTVAEKVDTTTFSVTPITESGATHQEVFGAVYFKSGAFFVHDINLNMYSMTTSGQYTWLGVTDHYIRGMAYTSYPRCIFSSVPFISTPGNYVCGAGTTITLDSGNLYDATNWQWYSGSCGGTLIGTGTSVFVSPTSTTTYYVRGESGCVTTATCANITVAVSPPAATGAISGPSVICTLTSATYSVVPVDGATTYTWTVPTGLNGMTVLSGQGTSSINVAISAGTILGNVTCTASNACGTSAATTLAITKKPPVPGAIYGPTDVCGLGSASYSIAPVVGATSYAWTLPSGITLTGGVGTVSITVTIGTSFTQGVIKVAAVNACGSVPGAVLTVYGKAPPTSITGPTNVCGMITASYSTPVIANANSYSWIVPNTWTFTGQGTNSIVATLPANINNTTYAGTVRVASVSTCGNSAYKILNVSYCRDAISAGNQSEGNQVTVSSVYPNPAGNEFTISMNSDAAMEATLEVFDVLGNKIIQKEEIIESGETLITTNIQQFQAGMYFVRIIDSASNVLFTERMIKE